MTTEAGRVVPIWKPIETLPFEERRFRFRWADGTVEEMDGYDPEGWSENGHRVAHPIEWAEA